MLKSLIQQVYGGHQLVDIIFISQMGMNILRRYNLSSINDKCITAPYHMFNTTGVLKETGNSHPSPGPGFTIVFGCIRVAFLQLFVSCFPYFVLSSFCVLWTYVACVSRLTIMDCSIKIYI